MHSTEANNMKRTRVDRISCLHESILYQILSFLPVKDVVQTSILSKRWQRLWNSLPYLNFEESSFTNTERFKNFVDNFLLCHDQSSIIRFRLKFRNACVSSCMDAWIRAAVSAGVQELEIYSRIISIHNLPTSLFTSNSLVVLKLTNLGAAVCRNPGSKVWFPDSFCFPKMKSMYLCNIILPKNFSDQLVKSPYLAELFMECCNIDISQTTEQDVAADDRYSMNLSNLSIAEITLLNLEFSPDELKILGLFLCKFIRRLPNVEALHLRGLSIWLLQPLRNLSDHLATFWSLKHLKLRLSTWCAGDYRVMACLLRCSPLLQSLHIHFLNFFSFLAEEFKPEDFPPICLPPLFKWIKINNFRGSKNEMELLRIILGNAQVLEKIILQFDIGYDNDRLNMWRQKLLSLPRRSTCCAFNLLDKDQKIVM